MKPEIVHFTKGSCNPADISFAVTTTNHNRKKHCGYLVAVDGSLKLQFLFSNGVIKTMFVSYSLCIHRQIFRSVLFLPDECVSIESLIR
jgi:hypothetical protein